MAKLFAGDTAMWVADKAVQILGGYGYVKEFPVERFFRDALRHGDRKRSMRFGGAQVEVCDDQRAAVDQKCRPLGEEFHRLVRDRDVEILRHGDRGAGARRDTCGVTLTNSAS